MKNGAHTDIWHTIIIGAGASGLMCAGSFNAPKLVLEHNSIPGKKLNITGGGKCNLTHLNISARDYVSTQTHFPHAALAAFTPQDMLELIRQARLPVDIKENGQIFARDARQITQWLYQRAKQHNTSFSFNTRVLRISYEKNLFCIQSSIGKLYASNVVLACGGLSYPDLGATGFAWQAATQLGLTAQAPRPALAGLQMPADFRAICRSLTGNSLPVSIRCGKHTETEQLLFTHRGISGPAVLQTSLYWKEGEPICINFLPQLDVLSFLREHKTQKNSFSKLLAPFLTEKIAKHLLADLDVRAADAPKQVLCQTAVRLNALTVVPTATAGYTHAEVTAGGIDTKQLLPQTLVCKNIPGLFVIGEAVDVTGRLGGYNLQWAWSSAWAAARALTEKAY